MVFLTLLALPASALAQRDPTTQPDALVGEPEEGFMFAPGRAFAPLRADPRWPRWTAQWQFSTEGERLVGEQNIAQVSFGDDIAIWRSVTEEGDFWEFGLQAAAFSAFGPDTESINLLNTDYIVGPYLAADWTRGSSGPSAILRAWHQSSHLGDEFVLYTLDEAPVGRVNFSYEIVEFIGAWTFRGEATESADLRVYGGAGYIISPEPEDYGNSLFRYGLELRALQTRLGRPFVAAEAQHLEGRDYQLDLQVVTGLEFFSDHPSGRRLAAMLLYRDGREMNGQFFEEDNAYWGAGLQFSF